MSTSSWRGVYRSLQARRAIAGEDRHCAHACDSPWTGAELGPSFPDRGDLVVLLDTMSEIRCDLSLGGRSECSAVLEDSFERT